MLGCCVSLFVFGFCFLVFYFTMFDLFCGLVFDFRFLMFGVSYLLSLFGCLDVGFCFLLPDL